MLGLRGRLPISGAWLGVNSSEDAEANFHTDALSDEYADAYLHSATNSHAPADQHSASAKRYARADSGGAVPD